MIRGGGDLLYVAEAEGGNVKQLYNAQYKTQEKKMNTRDRDIKKQQVKIR